MTAKDYLIEIHTMKERLKISRKILENCSIDYNSVHAIDYSADKVQTSPKNALEEAAWKMIDRQNKALEDVFRLSGEINKRLAEINSLSEPIYIEILYQRYYEGVSLYDIAEKMDKSKKTINNLHGKALLEFQKKYLQNTEPKKD